jgi:hypothetical protein
MLTKDDLDQLRGIVQDIVDTSLLGFEKKAITPLADKVENLEESVSHLPSKDEFYEKMDEIMGELRAIREEQAVMSDRLSGHENRITKLEEAHPEVAASLGRYRPFFASLCVWEIWDGHSRGREQHIMTYRALHFSAQECLTGVGFGLRISPVHSHFPVK